MKKSIVVFSVFMVVVCSTVYCAEENLINKLNLSRTQVKQIQTQEKFRNKELAKIREQIQLKEKELKNELAKAEPNQNKVQNITQEINQLQAKQLNSKVESILASKKIMNKEQLKEMEKIQEQKRVGELNKYQYKQGNVQGNADGGRGGK